MDVALFLIAVLVVLAGGLGATALLLRDRLVVEWAELVACALLLGTLVTGVSWFAAALVLPGNASRAFPALVAVGLGGAGVAAWRRRRPRLEGARAALLVLLPITLLVTWLAATTPAGWDGMFVWDLKASAISVQHGLPWDYFHDESRQWSHPRYPLLVPLSRAWLWGTRAAPHQGASHAGNALCFAAAVGGLLLGPARRLGRGTGALALLVLATTPLTLLGEGGLTSAYADFPLAVYYLGAVLYLLPTGVETGPHDWRLAACLSAALPWVKSEGSILWGCWLVVAALALGRRRWREAAAAVLPGALTWAAWATFSRFITDSQPTFLRPSLGLLRERVSLAPAIARSCARIALDRPAWSLLWLLFAGAVLLRPLWGITTSRRELVVALAAMLPIPFYGATYLFSTWSPVTLHVESSFARLLLQVSLVAIVWVAATTAAVLAQILGVGGSTPGRVPWGTQASPHFSSK